MSGAVVDILLRVFLPYFLWFYSIISLIFDPYALGNIVCS